LFATLFTFMAFNVVDQILIAAGVEGIFGWDATVVAIGVSVIGAVLAIFGHDWLHKVFRILLYVSVPVFLVLTIGIVTGAAGGTPQTGLGFDFVGFMVMFTVAAGYNITYAPYVSDYSRYMPKETRRGAIIASVFIGAAGSPLWLIPLGAWLTTRLGAFDGLVALRDAGDAIFDPLGTLAAIMSVLALVATMGINAYSAMLSVVTGIDSVKKVEPTRSIRVITIVALAVVWTVAGLALTTAPSIALTNALILMLFLLVPWTAVNLMDYFIVRHGQYSIVDIFKPNGMYGVWSREGLITYFTTLIVTAPFLALIGDPESPYTGFMAENLDFVDYSSIVGLVVAGGLYYLLTRGRDLAAEEAVVERSERELAGLSHDDAVVVEPVRGTEQPQGVVEMPELTEQRKDPTTE
jgi:purine-cytosine permease-like protein